jgi:hypothetical protein
MARKMKTRKTSSKPNKSSARKPASRKALLKKVDSKQKTAVKKPARKKVVVKKKVAAKKKAAVVKTPPKNVASSSRIQGLDTLEIERDLARARTGVMSGDLQGLSRKSRAASESVDELLEEGNAYEAGILKGVEEAEDAKEVLTHEVLADDVPEEYLDEE